MKRNKRYIVFFFVYVCSIPLYGQYKLNYSNFIKNVLVNNPAAQSADNVSKIAKFQYNAMRGNYDPQLKGSHENKTFIGKNYYSIINAEISQPIFTSQSIKLGYDYGIGNNINPELQTSVNGLPYLGMEASILQGLMFDKRRANVLKAKYYVSYANSDRDAQLNELLFESSVSYFDWIYFVKQRSINSYFLSLAQQRFQGVEQLVIQGERPSVDTIEASLFIQSRLLDLQNAELDNIKSQNQLASFNWNESGNASQQYSFIPSDSLDAYFEKAKQVFFNKIKSKF